MLNKIRLLFLKRKWLSLNNQVIFLRRELRKLQAELDGEFRMIAERKVRRRELSPIHMAFYDIERLKPLKNKITELKSAIDEIDERKRDVRLKIEGLKPVNVNGLNCLETA